nr:retrovirus-related Pol polyprotein from transposon TNT 1-94 [Tanacetum cinerariifolium]
MGAHGCREAKKVPNTVSASSRTKSITVSQPSVITKKDMNSNSYGLSSTGLDNTKTRRPQPRSNTKNDRVPSASKSSRSKNKEVKVEEHHRNLLLFKKNKHSSSACNNSKIDSQDVIYKVVCAKCKKYLNSVNHDVCLNSMNGKKSRGRKHKANVSKNETQKEYRPKVSKSNIVGPRESLATPKPRKPRFLLRWSPTGKMFDQDGKLIAPSNSESHIDCSNGDNACTSNTLEPKIKLFPNSTSLLGSHDECLLNYVNDKNSRGKKQIAKVSFKENQMTYQPKVTKPKKVIQICLRSVDSGCSKHMTGNLKLIINFVWKFVGTVRFENDHVAAILDFGDLQWGNILITRVYFVKGLGHNLFSVGQFCDSDLEVAFRRNACFVRNLERVDLLKGDRSRNLYTINLHEMASVSPICLMARASSTKSWLWHQYLSHLNFDTINDLARNDLVSGLPKFKYNKEHLCPSCEQGKSKRVSHPPKLVPNSRSRLHLLHIDLCGPMRIASINGKRYVLVIVNDYSHYTWVHFLRSKDEAPEVIITFLKRITNLLQSPVIIIRTDNDIGKLGDKGDIGFFIGYSADSYTYRIYNRRTKKIMETMNVSFDELSTMAFEQRSSKPGLQSMTSGQISLGLDLTYAPSTITLQQPSEGELDLLFKAMYDDYIGGQPSATVRTIPPA